MNLHRPHGLVIHRATRTDALAAHVAQVLAEPLPDPFATEIISVPTPGVERWLGQTLAARLGASGRADGVCAGIDFPRLDQLILRVTEQSTGIDPATDPWHPDRSVWSVLQVLDANMDQPWLATLRSHLAPGTASRRYVTARRIVDLFRSYAGQRPQLLEQWRSGAAVDVTGNPLGDDTRWQAMLWAALCTQIDGPDPVQRIRHTAAVLADDPDRIDLPERLQVFGLTRLAADQAMVLKALAAGRRVHLWLPHPSPVMWQRVAEPAAVRGPRATDPTAVRPQHRLNRRLCRDARELQLCLADLDAETPEPAVEGPPPATLLGRLQSAIRDDSAAPERQPVEPGDDSIRLHACHGPDRQVEVLREVVLGLLTDHPDLELRDIVVMCPDVETFAPLISACFALEGLPPEETHPGQQLRVRLADRSLREINPLLATLQSLLELGESRAGRSTILDLCAQAPVARRFGFTDADLERLRELVPAAGVRWGLHVSHRSRFGMGDFAQNTWRAGLARMLAGVALDDSAENVRQTVLPLAEIDSSDVTLVGRLVELMSRLDRIVASFTGPHSLPTWMAACREALALVTEVAPGDSWQLTHAWSELAILAASASPAETLVTPGDLRALLSNAFAGRPSRSNFRTGALTVCTMTPMRSVPHRVVILLGLDDGVFPRRTPLDGDDLLALDPWVGDRDRRSEDRQILLDAILAATERLVVIHSGADPQTGSRRPPAVPVAELRGAVADLCSGDPWPVVEVRHPLQPFAPANFHPVPFSFDPHARQAAEAYLRAQSEGAPNPRPSVLKFPPPVELAGNDVIEVELGALHRFFGHPARELLRSRAQLRFDDDPDDDGADEIPTRLELLDKWQVGERILQQNLAGVPMPAIRDAEMLRGEVPPKAFGLELLTMVAREVLEIRAVAEPWLEQPAHGEWINVQLGRWHLTGLVAGVRNHALLRLSYSLLSAKRRFGSWLDLLTLTAARPDVDWRAITIGRRGEGRILGPVSVTDARARLNELIALWARGQSEVVPVPPRTAALQVEEVRSGGDQQRLWKTWRREHDEAWARVGLTDSLHALNAQPAEARDGGGNRSAFQALAHRIWDPVLNAESML
jgi:exodeoxyribonuclease V gamma subunit